MNLIDATEGYDEIDDWDERQYLKACAQIGHWITMHNTAQRAGMRALVAERALTEDSSLDEFKNWLVLRTEANEAKNVFAVAYRNNWLQ